MLRKVLTCKPTNFQVEYQINPWMKPGTVDSKKALQQWENLMQAYRDNGIEVEVINQVEGLSDMVFAADQGLIVGKEANKIVMSSFKYSQRRRETLYFKNWFSRHGYKIETLPEGLYFEGGGECLPWKEKYFIGSGFRNSSQTHEYIAKEYGTEFISLELINQKYYHLDTCFFILNDTTAFYFPGAFSDDSIDTIEDLFPNLIEFTQAEMDGFAPNSVVSGYTVFSQSGNQDFKKKMESFGYKVVEVDVSEFIKSGGGIHCLTFELEREPQFSISLSNPQFQTQIQAS